ncbi:MAG TPA: acetamidase, partial [Dehalococcoidia bacterium]|nr:acetamidase [Dehalococcoidia bacterium]
IGVAPAGDFTPTSGPSGNYGGNIDYNEIREKSIVHLPVFHEGAYLYVGDGHALQGDGEPLGSGVETSMDVEFMEAGKSRLPSPVARASVRQSVGERLQRELQQEAEGRVLKR